MGVSYQGIGVDVANELNKAISNFYETFDVQKFGGILAPAGNTKLGQKITGATAAYSPVRNSFLVNKKKKKYEGYENGCKVFSSGKGCFATCT